MLDHVENEQEVVDVTFFGRIGSLEVQFIVPPRPDELLSDGRNVVAPKFVATLHFVV